MREKDNNQNLKELEELAFEILYFGEKINRVCDIVCKHPENHRILELQHYSNFMYKSMLAITNNTFSVNPEANIELSTLISIYEQNLEKILSEIELSKESLAELKKVYENVFDVLVTSAIVNETTKDIKDYYIYSLESRLHLLNDNVRYARMSAVLNALTELLGLQIAYNSLDSNPILLTIGIAITIASASCLYDNNEIALPNSSDNKERQKIKRILKNAN